MQKTIALVLLGSIASVLAHGHHAELTEEQKNAPIDAILWIHMGLQLFVWGFLFPIGMVLGISRSKWHVPLQVVGYVLTAAGILLGHSHKGRQFLPGIHGKFANILLAPMAAQLALGIYLKLHIHGKSLRPYAVKAHGIVGKAFPIIGWSQMLFGAIAFRGYCRGGELSQCLAHYIMGSGFIAYGIIIAILFIAGEAWVRRSGRSLEWWDSWVILLWGIVNTFTEHHGGGWTVKDMQHSMLGVLWWTGGILGVYLSRNNQRNVVPSVILILTGWAMSEHAQELMISTKVHATFGHTLMLAGLARIIEVVVFSPKSGMDDNDTGSEHTIAVNALNDGESSRAAAGRAFKHLPPFLLVASGILFMSGTNEELKFVHSQEMDHVTYLLIMFSLAFILYALVIFLINLALSSGRNANNSSSSSENIEMTAGSRPKWYARVPATTAEEEERLQPHVIGDDD